MEKCPYCKVHLVCCPCCDTYFCRICDSTEEELLAELEEEEG